MIRDVYIVIESYKFEANPFEIGPNKRAEAEYYDKTLAEIKRKELRSKDIWSFYFIVHCIELNLFGLKLRYVNFLY